MNAKTPSFFEQLGQRFSTKAINDSGNLGRPYRYYNDMILKISDFDKALAERKAKGDLSEKGLRDFAREYAAKKIAPTVARSRGLLAMQKNDLSARRGRVGKPSLDKKDAAGAAVRIELRRMMRVEMTPSERISFALKATDPDIVSAILEMLPVMSGINEEIWSQVETSAIERHVPGALEAFEEERAEIETAEAAVSMAASHIRDACGFAHHEFDKWNSDATADVTREMDNLRDADSRLAAEKKRIDALWPTPND